jgi:arylsulfatase
MSRGFSAIKNALTLGEVLRTAGYRTLASGKHHCNENLYDRGFDHYFGLRDGCCNFWNPGNQRPGEGKPARKRVRSWCIDSKTYKPYTPKDPKFYATDAFTDYALKWLDEPECRIKPFLLYLAFNAPHYPLHAWPTDIAKYKGRYDAGYQKIRDERYRRQIKMGLIDPKTAPIHNNPQLRSWSSMKPDDRRKEAHLMEIYAAMLDRVDQNIGRILAKLKDQKKLDNTVIMFASDNGACAEMPRVKQSGEPGTVTSYPVVGKQWATVSDTPLRYWKNYSHEGGICTPFVLSWPGHVSKPGSFCRQPGHFIDVMATCVALSGAEYPTSFKGARVTPMQGVSLLSALEGEQIQRPNPLFWHWSQGAAIRDGRMKAVRWGKEWQLYDIVADRNEMHNLAGKRPDVLRKLTARWTEMSNSFGGKK